MSRLFVRGRHYCFTGFSGLRVLSVKVMISLWCQRDSRCLTCSLVVSFDLRFTDARQMYDVRSFLDISCPTRFPLFHEHWGLTPGWMEGCDKSDLSVAQK